MRTRKSGALTRLLVAARAHSLGAYVLCALAVAAVIAASLTALPAAAAASGSAPVAGLSSPVGTGAFAGWASAPGVKAVSGDFNGDRRQDVALVGGTGWWTVPVAFSNGNGTFSVTNSPVADIPGWAQNPTAKVVAGDVNHDGRADLMLVGGTGWWTVPVAFSNGNGTFTVTNSPV